MMNTFRTAGPDGLAGVRYGRDRWARMRGLLIDGASAAAGGALTLQPADVVKTHGRIGNYCGAWSAGTVDIQRWTK